MNMLNHQIMTNNKEKLFPGDNWGRIWAPIVFIPKGTNLLNPQLKYDHNVIETGELVH